MVPPPRLVIVNLAGVGRCLGGSIASFGAAETGGSPNVGGCGRSSLILTLGRTTRSRS